MSASNTATIAEARKDLRKTIRRRRMMLHRILVQARLLDANPVTAQAESTECACHPRHPLSVGIDHIARQDLSTIHLVRFETAKETASRTECHLKHIIGDPYQEDLDRPNAHAALTAARAMLDAATEGMRIALLEKRNMNRVVRENRRIRAQEEALARLIDQE